MKEWLPGPGRGEGHEKALFNGYKVSDKDEYILAIFHTTLCL